MLPLTELAVTWGKLTINKQLDEIQKYFSVLKSICDFNCTTLKSCRTVTAEEKYLQDMVSNKKGLLDSVANGYNFCPVMKYILNMFVSKTVSLGR